MHEISLPAVNQIVHSVLENFSTLPVELIGNSAEQVRSEPEPVCCAVVYTLGPWNGGVSVVCSAKAAMRLTETVFGEPVSNPESEQVASVLKELANLIGGNIKGMFDVRSILSIPKTLDQQDWIVELPGSETVYLGVYQLENEQLLIRLHEAEEFDLGFRTNQGSGSK